MSNHIIFAGRLIVFALMHSLFATNLVKRLIGRTAGREPRAYRLIYNLLSLALFGWAMAAYRDSTVLYSASGIWRWLLYSGQAAAAVMILVCVRQTGAGDFLGLSQFGSAPPRDSRMVTGGCYALVRHPLYLYSTLFLLMNPDMTAQWGLLTVFSVVYFIIGALIEEHRLLKEFGEEYRCYREATPFLIPLPRRSNKT